MREITDADGLGPLLRSLRHQRLLPLRDVAKRAGLATSTLSRCERGKAGVDWATFQRVLGALDLQARVVIERRYVDLDAEIDRVAALSVLERLGDDGDSVVELVAGLRRQGVRVALCGATAAIVMGVPLSVRCVQLAFADEDVGAVPAAMRSCLGRLALPAGDPDRYVGPAELLAVRTVTPWRLIYCDVELTKMPARALERAVGVRLGDVEVPVLPLDLLLVDDPACQRMLDRFRDRFRDRFGDRSGASLASPA
jgi:transcriptional regulator with XRE-family HTH domain